MKIINSEFKTSVANANNILKDGLKEVAFVGRSNVGKSSLLNMLTNRNKLAKTSSTPGRTRLINYFLINNSFYFVDLPGYGFAKAGKEEIKKWQSLIDPYLINNEQLKGVCVLVDIRHVPNDHDRMMIEFLSYYQIPFIIVATKADKLSKSAIKPAVQKIANALKVGSGNIYAVSKDTRYGKEELLKKIEDLITFEPVSFDDFDDENENDVEQVMEDAE